MSAPANAGVVVEDGNVIAALARLKKRLLKNGVGRELARHSEFRSPGQRRRMKRDLARKRRAKQARRQGVYERAE